MAAAVRWASLGTPWCGSGMVSRGFGKRRHMCGHWKWSGQRGLSVGGRVGAFNDTEAELVMNGSVNGNEFGTLALLFDGQEDDGSVVKGKELGLNMASAEDKSNELYAKLAENALPADSGGEMEEETDSVKESDSEHSDLQVWEGQVETRSAASAYQQASRLLAAVHKTLDGLEDGLVKHAEELEATALVEDFAFSGGITVGDGQTAGQTSSQSLEVEQMREEIAVRDHLLELLRQEAIQAALSLKSATQAMEAAKGKISYLQEQLVSTSGFLEQEKEATQRALDLFSNSLLALSVAEERVKELEKQVEIGMQGRQDEEFSAEVASLKGLVDRKEKLIQARGDENHRNANMLLAGAKAREGLANAEKKIQLFTAQVARLEGEVRSRDMLLQEVKYEMVRSTDALKLAAQIKQELNASKQRELELNQDLDSQRAIVKELQQELAENHRAMQAEQALRQMEKSLKDLNLEVEMLREGVEARDNALKIMREEVDRSVEILTNAAENREAVRQLTSYVEELRAELAIKDEKIVSLREELARAEISLQQEMRVSNSTSSPPAVKESTAAPLPTILPAGEATMLKGKSVRRKQGNPRKPSPQSLE